MCTSILYLFCCKMSILGQKKFKKMQKWDFDKKFHKKNGKSFQKSVYIWQKFVYNKLYSKYGGAPDSIAGERKDKHTVDGVPTQKHST